MVKLSNDARLLDRIVADEHKRIAPELERGAFFEIFVINQLFLDYDLTYVVISSQSGHRLGALTAEQDAALATTPADELLSLSMLQPDQVTDSLHAYQLAKRGNSLRVMAEAVRWGKRGARINTISPGIIFTPLAKDELTGPRGAGYRRMLELSPVGRGGTPDEVATVAALLMGPDGAFITGSDVLMDGGVTASWFFGDLAPP